MLMSEKGNTEDAIGKGFRQDKSHLDVINKETSQEDRTVTNDHMDVEYTRMMTDLNMETDTANNADEFSGDAGAVESVSEEEQARLDEERRDKEEKARLAERKRQEEEKIKRQEEILCRAWFDRFGGDSGSPTPKYLLLKDVPGGRRFTQENVMKRTAWMGMALGIKARDQLPDMRRFVSKGQVRIAITAPDPEVAEKLMSLTDLGPCKVVIEKDPFKNTVSGVLVDHDDFLKHMSTGDIVDLFSDQGVIEVKKIGKSSSKAYRLIFDRLICPLDVTSQGEKRFFRIREYVPPPLRCFKCQRYDHTDKSCRATVRVCQRCGEEGHEAKIYTDRGEFLGECSNAEKCIHCEGNHQAGYYKCPTDESYKRVNEIMVLQKVSRVEAKSRVFAQVRGRSDATVVDVAVQLEQSRRREVDSRAGLAALETKVNEVLEGIKQVPVPMLPVTIDQELDKKILKAVEQATANILQKYPIPQAAPRTSDADLDERIRRAVGVATDQMRKQNKSEFERLNNLIGKQNQQIEALTKKNKNLVDETKNLREQLRVEKQKNNAKADSRPGVTSNSTSGSKRKSDEAASSHSTSKKAPASDTSNNRTVVKHGSEMTVLTKNNNKS